MTDLFPSRFLAFVQRLSIAIRQAPPTHAHGTNPSSAVGASQDFRDFRAYTPGDDLRRIDWNVYARTRHLFVRRFDHPAAVPVTVLMDNSRSMHAETPSRYSAGARAAAAVVSAGLSSGNRVRLVVGGDSIPVPARPGTGRRDLPRFLRDLCDPVGNGPGIAMSIARLKPALASIGSGVLVIVSDFFEERGVDFLIDSLRDISQRVLLIRTEQPGDRNPNFSGDHELVDIESERLVRMSMNRSLLGRYLQAYSKYFSTLDRFAAGRGMRQVTVDAAADIAPQLETLFRNGVLSI